MNLKGRDGLGPYSEGSSKLRSTKDVDFSRDFLRHVEGYVNTGQ